MHRANAVVTDSGQCSVFCCCSFFTFSAGICFPGMSMWCYCFWPTDVWESGSGSRMALPSLDRLKIYTAKQTQNAKFTGWKSVIGTMPAAKSHSMPHFRHFLFLAGQKSWNVSEWTCHVHHLKVWAELVPLSPVHLHSICMSLTLSLPLGCHMRSVARYTVCSLYAA